MSPHSGLVYSEASLDLVYNYVVNVGYKKADAVDGELIQDNFEQPLRKYFISIAASDSGVKRAVGNRNKNECMVYGPLTQD